MRKPHTPRRVVAGGSLLLSTLSIAALAAARPAAAAPLTQAFRNHAVQDLGTVAAATQVSATLWLKPRDEDGFAAAIAARTTPGAPLYRRWMSPVQVAAFAPDAIAVETLTASLKARGLSVVPGLTADSLRVSGSADAVARTFATTLHSFQDAHGTYRATTAEPTLSVPGSTAVAGITGLTTAHMTPYLVQQRNLTTNAPTQIPLAAAADPSSVFTTDCFVDSATFSRTVFRPNGGTKRASLTGPGYVASGVYPAKATCGYTADQIATHYGLDKVYAKGLRGEGQTIVLVDAYGSPTIKSDANAFSRMMGLPTLDSSNFKVVYPDGPAISNPYPTGWPGEISLDVEWAHAIAPKARLVLVVAPSDDAEEMVYALQYAVRHHLGDVISNSYGYPEAGFGPATARAFNRVIAEAALQGIAVNVSTGDSGDFGLGTPVGAASIPADSPFATAVGGTSLGVPSDNGPVESVWGNVETYIGSINGIADPPGYQGLLFGGGGGQSAYLEKPLWQHALTGTGRMLPDISTVADPFTGAIIVTPNDDGSASVVQVIGGTSLSSPVFSGIWALADQAAGASLGQAAPIIARLPSHALRDIVPIEATQSNLAGTIGLTSDNNPTYYDPAALLDLTATQPNGFVGTGVNITSTSGGIGAIYDLGFGADSSLMAQPGWDDATGWGAPNGIAFIQAAAWARWGLPFSGL